MLIAFVPYSVPSVGTQSSDYKTLEVIKITLAAYLKCIFPGAILRYLNLEDLGVDQEFAFLKSSLGMFDAGQMDHMEKP